MKIEVKKERDGMFPYSKDRDRIEFNKRKRKRKENI